ncbi:MAG: hypothetical protein ACM3NF_08255 [Gemmatimonadota bacterium]
MSVGIGLGLVLNVLVWTVAVLAAVGLASLAVIEYFPGTERTRRKRRRKERGAASAAAEDEKAERHRRAA